MTNLILATITAYVATGHLNAAGHKPIPGISIAVPRSVPLGSQVTINGHTYIADDRTARKYDGRFDIFMDSRKAAIQWGKQTNIVTIRTK
jgi:3D (Asp-Asp-Asp) domain-containing protein